MFHDSHYPSWTEDSHMVRSSPKPKVCSVGQLMHSELKATSFANISGCCIPPEYKNMCIYIYIERYDHQYVGWYIVLWLHITAFQTKMGTLKGQEDRSGQSTGRKLRRCPPKKNYNDFNMELIRIDHDKNWSWHLLSQYHLQIGIQAQLFLQDVLSPGRQIITTEIMMPHSLESQE